MEVQDCVVGLYQTVGRPLGDPFSTQDVSQLFGKVFHEPSNAEEVHAAITKISNGDSGWTCAGQNVLDVLREMEHQRVQNEKLYWECQLLNAVKNHQTQHVRNTRLTSDPFSLHHSYQNTIASPNKGERKSEWSMRKLRKAHRQSWVRLVVEGLASLLPAPGCPVRSLSWGLVSLSELLLLVEVKYDVVNSLLYTEMLKEDYSADVWENMSPWEQCEAEERLAERAEQALESHDSLHLAQLPGALRTYRFQDQCWSAVSFLCNLDKLCEEEKSALEGLAHRLSAEGLRRACLHIRLATVRAQRERQSYGAVLAARQSWDSWPDVCSPQRAEQASLLLQSEDHEHKVEALSQTPQQALLQLLVLTQEQERRQLMALLHTLCLEDIQGPSCTQQGPKEGTSTAEEGVITKVQPFIWVGGGRDLRADCVRRLQLIHSHLRSQGQSQGESQGQSQPRTQDCGQVLLMDLLRLQDVQASVLLSVLLDTSPDALPSLLEDWRCSLQAQCESNLHQLLSSAQPKSAEEQSSSVTSAEEQSSSVTSAKEQSSSVTSAEEQSSSVTSAKEQSSSVTSAEEQSSSVGAAAAEASAQPDLCADCGEIMVALPYLEVLGASDIISNPNTAEEEPEEPQASLITMAWSKPHGLDYPEQGEEAPKESNESEQQQTQCGTDTGDEFHDSHTQLNVTKCEENTVQVLVPEDLLTSPPNSSCSEGHVSSDVAVRVEDEEAEGNDPLTTPAPLLQETRPEMVCFGDREQTMSVADREQAVRSLVDLQRRVEQRQQRDRQRQLLKVQERLSIIQSRKAEEEQLGLKDRLKLLTHDLPQEDLQQQKAVVKERLDQLRRERSCILMSKRDKNTAGFKELLGPAGLHHIKIKEDAD